MKKLIISLAVIASAISFSSVSHEPKVTTQNKAFEVLNINSTSYTCRTYCVSKNWDGSCATWEQTCY